MTGRARITGIAALGLPTQYRPVVYRVYYEDPSSGQRVSALALARSGQASALATLAEAYRDEGNEVSASLAVIAPITLIARDPGILERLESAARPASGDPVEAAEELCNSMLEKVTEAVNLAQRTKILKEEVANNTIIFDFIAKNKDRKDVPSNIELRLNIARRASVIYELDVGQAGKPEMLTSASILHRGLVLPLLCKYRGTRLKYSHYIRRDNQDVEGGARDLGVDLYVAVTPLAMATIGAEGGLVVFRDVEPKGRFNMGAIQRAALLESINALLAAEASETSGGETSTSIVFYDVTTGLNVIVATLTQVTGFVTDVHIARLAAEGKSIRTLRVYMYSGDPVMIQGDAEALMHTAHDANISYNYVKLADVSLADGADSGWVEAVASNLRAHIDRLVARLRGTPGESREASFLALALRGLASAYLAKLGLIQWSLVSFRRFHRSIVELEEPLRELVMRGPIPAATLSLPRRGNILFIEYRPQPPSQGGINLLQLYFAGEGAPAHPDAVVAALRLAEALSLLACKAGEGACEVTENSGLPRSGSGDSVYVDLSNLHDLVAGRLESDAAARIFASIVEPGTRTVLEHELRRVISDGESYLAEALRHWTTGGRGGERRFELDVGSLREAYCRCLRELSGAEGSLLASGEVALETVDGNACIIGPARPGQGQAGSECPSISTAELRNFVAHLGFTRLMTGWGFLVVDDYRGGCKIKGMVVRDTRPSIECVAARLAGFA